MLVIVLIILARPLLSFSFFLSHIPQQVVLSLHALRGLLPAILFRSQLFSETHLQSSTCALQMLHTLSAPYSRQVQGLRMCCCRSFPLSVTLWADSPWAAFFPRVADLLLSSIFLFQGSDFIDGSVWGISEPLHAWVVELVRVLKLIGAT